MKQYLVIGHNGAVSVLFENAERPLDCRDNIFGLNALELENRASAEDCAVDVEVGVFCGRCYKGDFATLDIIQECLLLFLVEILNLVKIEEYAVRRSESVKLGNDSLDVSR